MKLTTLLKGKKCIPSPFTHSADVKLSTGSCFNSRPRANVHKYSYVERKRVSRQGSSSTGVVTRFKIRRLGKRS